MHGTGEPTHDPPRDAGSGENPAPGGDPAPAPIVIELSGREPRTANVRADPWAHRRGEPRVFAFLWTIYLLVAVGGSLLWLSRSTVVSTSTYGPAARIMLLVVAAGATVLWPMVRLSQASPRGSGVRAALADVVVVLFPMQMIVWPLVMLAQWPLGIVGALSLLTALWVLLIGGIIAIGTSGRAAEEPHDRGLGERAAWMAVCILLVAAVPTLALMRRAVSGPEAALPEWVPMLSPFTAVPALTGQGFSGPQHPVSEAQWLAVSSIVAVAMLAWLFALIRQRANRGRGPGESASDGGGLAAASGLD